MSDDRQDHEAKAGEVERELDDMQERSERLGEEIEGAGDEWERRKADDKVPGAAGEPSQADGPEPEAEYPTKSDAEDDGEELDFGRSLADDGDDEG
jgi:hypothetical protein